MADYISVTVLNKLAKQVLEACEPLNSLVVCGEISNFTRHYKSGHLYFTLKDDSAAVKTVMFRDKARLLRFAPQNGMMVLAYGHVTIYERDGAFQFYADYLRPFGAGAAQMAFDALKQKLEKEGLFAPEHKRPLPPMPRCIGIVTSKTGAALQDVRNVLQRRWPMVRLLLAPVSVQGIEAEDSIVSGIRTLDADSRPDLILVTRGGGSKEDLWVFNSEKIARTVYACHKPVVSAVGHEIDYTILDYVADLRAPTPSAAAELCVPDQQQIREEICNLGKNIQKNIQYSLQVCYNTFRSVRPAETLRGIQAALDARQRNLSACAEQMRLAKEHLLRSKFSELGAAANLAASLNPYAILSRGYAMVEDSSGNCVTVPQLKAGDCITLRSSNALAQCTVDTVILPEADRKYEESTKNL